MSIVVRFHKILKRMELISYFAVYKSLATINNPFNYHLDIVGIFPVLRCVDTQHNHLLWSRDHQSTSYDWLLDPFGKHLGLPKFLIFLVCFAIYALVRFMTSATITVLTVTSSYNL